jgi:hypothetical protein
VLFQRGGQPVVSPSFAVRPPRPTVQERVLDLLLKTEVTPFFLIDLLLTLAHEPRFSKKEEPVDPRPRPRLRLRRSSRAASLRAQALPTFWTNPAPVAQSPRGQVLFQRPRAKPQRIHLSDQPKQPPITPREQPVHTKVPAPPAAPPALDLNAYAAALAAGASSAPATGTAAAMHAASAAEPDYKAYADALSQTTRAAIKPEPVPVPLPVAQFDLASYAQALNVYPDDAQPPVTAG